MLVEQMFKEGQSMFAKNGVIQAFKRPSFKQGLKIPDVAVMWPLTVGRRVAIVITLRNLECQDSVHMHAHAHARVSNRLLSRQHGFSKLYTS